MKIPDWLDRLTDGAVGCLVVPVMLLVLVFFFVFLPARCERDKPTGYTAVADSYYVERRPRMGRVDGRMRELPGLYDTRLHSSADCCPGIESSVGYAEGNDWMAHNPKHVRLCLRCISPEERKTIDKKVARARAALIGKNRSDFFHLFNDRYPVFKDLEDFNVWLGLADYPALELLHRLFVRAYPEFDTEGGLSVFAAYLGWEEPERDEQ